VRLLHPDGSLAEYLEHRPSPDDVDERAPSSDCAKEARAGVGCQARPPSAGLRQGPSAGRTCPGPGCSSRTAARRGRRTTAASWAGTCPGSNESAGRVKPASTRPGNLYLKGALGIAAMSAARSKGTCLSAKYRRIASRRGPVKAIVAVEHAILIAIWNMIINGVLYDDPGSDFYTRRNPGKARQRAVDQLRQMGYSVTLEPLKTATGQ
jgi:hypothetical protein